MPNKALHSTKHAVSKLPFRCAPFYGNLNTAHFANECGVIPEKKTMNLLFVCSENRLRSPTAEAVFSEYQDIDAIGAGTNSDAETPVSGDLIIWADVILVMEKTHRNKVSKKYKELLKGKRLVCLDISR